MKKEPFYSVIPLLSDLYGIEVDEDQFETLGMVAWDKIGNKEFCLRRVILKPIALPYGGSYIDKLCDISEIEAITLPYEDCEETSAIYLFPENYKRPVENWIEGNKRDVDSMYISGKFVNYTETADKIFFTQNYKELHMLYKSYLFDEDGLPLINEREKQAIAAFIAYSTTYKEGLKTKNSATVQLAQLLKKDWMKACDHARTPEYLSQNEMKEILDVMTSWDRHFYGRTNKVMR